MRESYLLFTLLVLLMPPPTCSQFCLSYDSSNATPLNSVRQAASPSCLPCLPRCLQCDSPADPSCSSGACSPSYYYDGGALQCLRCPAFCSSCEKIPITTADQAKIKGLRVPYPYSMGLQCIQCSPGYYLTTVTMSKCAADPDFSVYPPFTSTST